MKIGLFVLLLVTAIADSVEWTRTTFDGKGGSEDLPQPQTLRYFTAYPSLHDVSGDFCYLCTEKQRITAAKAEVVRADVHLLGTFNGRKVYDVLYYFDGESQPRWKSVLVQRGRDTYNEIIQVHQISRMGVGPTRVIPGNRICLADNCDRSGCIDGCYRIERGGPVYVGIVSPR